jgi:hypothetical protein
MSISLHIRYAGDYLAVVERYIDALTTDPDLALPHRLCPLVVRAAMDQPFVRALQTGDVDILGILLEQPYTEELLGTLGPAALGYSVLSVWRRYRLARTDWALDEQAYPLRDYGRFHRNGRPSARYERLAGAGHGRGGENVAGTGPARRTSPPPRCVCAC